MYTSRKVYSPPNGAQKETFGSLTYVIMGYIATHLTPPLQVLHPRYTFYIHTTCHPDSTPRLSYLSSGRARGYPYIFTGKNVSPINRCVISPFFLTHQVQGRTHTHAAPSPPGQRRNISVHVHRSFTPQRGRWSPHPSSLPCPLSPSWTPHHLRIDNEEALDVARSTMCPSECDHIY